MAQYVARMGTKLARAVGIINQIDMGLWFNLYFGKIETESFIDKMRFNFCPRVGECIKYFNDEYVVENVIHTEDIVILIVRFNRAPALNP